VNICYAGENAGQYEQGDFFEDGFFIESAQRPVIHQEHYSRQRCACRFDIKAEEICAEAGDVEFAMSVRA